jgi:hypothetical protein
MIRMLDLAEVCILPEAKTHPDKRLQPAARGDRLAVQGATKAS